jgi:hypothetical protein
VNVWAGECAICGRPVEVGAAWAVGLSLGEDATSEEDERPGGVHEACADELFGQVGDGGCVYCTERRKEFIPAGRYGGDPSAAALLWATEGTAVN